MSRSIDAKVIQYKNRGRQHTDQISIYQIAVLELSVRLYTSSNEETVCYLETDMFAFSKLETMLEIYDLSCLIFFISSSKTKRLKLRWDDLSLLESNQYKLLFS